MSEFLGSRISLISKSDIRYAGILHEINSSDSTVSLQNVRSYGTEGRKGNLDEEIAPSDQVYEFIIFRGSDVKDLRIEEGPAAKENNPPAVPSDPAIVGARPRPGAGPPGAGPQGAPGFGPGPGPNMYYPPPPAGWGRPGVPPGPGFGGMGYPPPWGALPGQNFPPPGPGPWNNFQYPPGPPMPPGAPGQGNRQGQGSQGQAPPSQEGRHVPIGAGPDKQRPGMPVGHAELPIEPKSLGQASIPSSSGAPAPPVDSKPSVEEVKATAASLNRNGQPELNKPAPTGPRNNRVIPAVPIPAVIATGPQQAATKPANEAQSAAASAAALRDATQAARAAVAVAMSKLDGQPVSAQPLLGQNGNAMDNLAKKVNEMRVDAATRGTATGSRGRGRGGRPGKVEVPDSDFDFASSNAKFNKENVVKEAIAGSPLGEDPTAAAAEEQETVPGNAPPAYNKTRSFFDNISSEAKDRAENNGQKPGGREWRGEEQRRNMETFGQGSVDGGYRHYRGRGRGRGGTRGRGYSQVRGGRGGFRGTSDGAVPS